MIKLFKILSEIKIIPKVTKDLAEELWYKVTRDPRWIERDESYMVKYDKFLHNQTLKNVERSMEGLSNVDFADNPWDQIRLLSGDQLTQWYIELKKLVDQDKINEIKIIPKITVQKIIDLNEDIKNSKIDYGEVIQIYFKFGYEGSNYIVVWKKWLKSLSQSQLNLLYHELLKLK